MNEMKKLMNFWLMAALVCGLSMSVTSCKDDDDDNTSEQRNEDADPMASFCFIGAADRRDTPGGIKTRRYRVYKEFIRRLGLEQQFELAFYDEQSLAILVNRTAVTDISTYAQRLLEFI